MSMRVEPANSDLQMTNFDCGFELGCVGRKAEQCVRPPLRRVKGFPPKSSRQSDMSAVGLS